MRILSYLKDKENIIIEKWFDVMIESYPADARKFFNAKEKQFSNPIGYTLSKEIEIIFKELIIINNPKLLENSLESIIKIKAVQDFSASQAVEFLFQLKQIIRQELKDVLKEKEILTELLEFESRIDNTILIAFDLYMKSREILYDIKANEVKRRNFKMIERLNKKYEEIDTSSKTQDSRDE